MDAINPLAAIEAGRMMLKHLGEDEAAGAIQDAVAYATTGIKSMSAGKMGYTTSQVGDMVAEHVTEN
jgi:3-isopropylmalate dehydrogenase